MAVSSDGVVTATVDAATASIKLAVNFVASGSPIVGTAATTVYAVTVTEQTSGNQVRGISSAPGGVINGIDHEAAFASSLSYVAKAYGVTGNLLATSTAASITLPVPAIPAMWLKSLSKPSMSVMPVPQAAPLWAGDVDEGTIWVQGRPDPIVIQSARRFPSTTMTVYTQTASDEAALQALLDTPSVYLAQFPGLGQADCYVTVGRHSKVGVDVSTDPFRVWVLPLQQVTRPPVAGWSVAIPGKTYADSTLNFPLYSNRTGTYLSRSS